MKVLAVIDMQPYFMDRYTVAKQVRKNTKRWKCIFTAIKHAMDNDWLILIVEYNIVFGNGTRTHRKITNMIARYDKVETIRKNGDDGSKDIVKALTPYSVDEIVVIGANADACVQYTLRGLVFKYKTGVKYQHSCQPISHSIT